MIQAFLVSFGVIFVAELPDKTMFATIVLASKYRRPWAVLAGVCLAMAAHAVLAVFIGEALRRLPQRPVQLCVAALFAVGGIIMLRSDDDDELGGESTDGQQIDGGQTSDDTRAAGRPTASVGAVIGASALVIGLAEFGDFTQLATVGVVAKYGYPVAVALGSIIAHAVVGGLAVAAGTWLQQRLPVRVIQRAAGLMFIVFGMATLIAALS